MPIRSIEDINARRQKELDATALPPAAPAPSAASSSIDAQAKTTQGRVSPPPPAPPQRRRGHAQKNENGKYMPTGDYPKGFAHPPVEHRFQPNNKRSPGRRPKKVFSHDETLTKQLDQKRKVRIDGKERSMSVGELLIATSIKNALQGKDRPLKEMRQEVARLFPGMTQSTPTGIILNASDALSMAELEAEIRREVLADLMRTTSNVGSEPEGEEQ